MVLSGSEKIDEIIGRPFQLKASGPYAFDCRGVVVWLTKELLGVELPDIFDGPVQAKVEAFAAHYQRLPNLAAAEFGDIVHAGGIKGFADQHVAFVEGPGRAVTASAGSDVHRVTFSDLRRYPSVVAYRLKCRC